MDNKRKLTGKNVIFLISLPRSGSTLLQHILGNHPDIAASAEPWVLFPHILALRKNAIKGIYSADIGRIALLDFLDQTKAGEETYFKAIRKYSDYIYESFLQTTAKSFFVDKTSRYYLALKELYRVYPDAKYIFLIRNPVSVLASFIENMVNGDIKALGQRIPIRTDLLDGYKLLAENIENSNIDSITVNYEALINSPEFETSRLCRFLNVSYEPSMIEYGGKNRVFKGKLIDPKSIHKHNLPVRDYLSTWEKILDSDAKRKFAYDYLIYLGEELIDILGYDFDELIKQLSDLGLSHNRKLSFQKIMIESSSPSVWMKVLLSISRGHFKHAIYITYKTLLK